MNRTRLAIGIGAFSFLLGWGAVVASVVWASGHAGSWSLAGDPAPKLVRADPTRIVRVKGHPDYGWGKIDSAKVAALQTRISRNPNDADARARLMMYAWRKGYEQPALDRVYREQVVWFVANLPDSPFLAESGDGVDGYLQAPTYKLLIQLYEEALRAHPRNVAILDNFASMVLVHETPHAIGLLQRAVALDPKNPERYDRLAFALLLGNRHKSGIDRRRDSGLAIEALTAQRQLSKESNRWTFMEAAFDAERRDVLDHETAAAIHDKEPDEVHLAHTLLGRLAAEGGDLEGAKRHLRASLEVSDPSEIGSYRLQMELAASLLKRGERQAVLEYLKACERCGTDSTRSQWLEQVARGETPDWSER